MRRVRAAGLFELYHIVRYRTKHYQWFTGLVGDSAAHRRHIECSESAGVAGVPAAGGGCTTGRGRAAVGLLSGRDGGSFEPSQPLGLLCGDRQDAGVAGYGEGCHGAELCGESGGIL
jgi:hypothetical protein